MPLTLDEFLAVESTLASIGRAVLTADRHERRRLAHDEAALRKMITAQWESGCAGWLTAAEGELVAAELTAEAEHQQIAARAFVRDDYLVFTGGRRGEQLLHLGSTSPVRARKHWPGYLQACPAVRQLDLLGRVFGWARGKLGQR